MKSKILLFLCFLIIACSPAQAFSCKQLFANLITKKPFYGIGLNNSYRRQLLNTYINSPNKSQFTKLLEELNSSVFTKIGNLIKFRSKDIFQAIELLDQVNFDSQYFLKKLLNSQPLSLAEKRAFYLLTHKDYWFKEGLFKNSLQYYSQSISLVELVENSLQKFSNLATNPQFGNFFSEMNTEGFFSSLFKSDVYKSNFADEVKRISDSSSSLQIREKLSEMESLYSSKLESARFKTEKKYYQFRLDQLYLMKSILIDKQIDVGSLTVRHSLLFARIPRSLRSIENMTRYLVAIAAFSIGADYLFGKYFEIREITTSDVTELGNIQSQLEEHRDLTLSLEEELEQKLNSGEITEEEFFQAIEALNKN